MPLDTVTERKTSENPEKPAAKHYVKAMLVNNLSDVSKVKAEVERGNVVIARITPLTEKSVEDTEKAVEELCNFVEEIGGDIGRLGEERLVITPPSIRIWRRQEGEPSEHITST